MTKLPCFLSSVRFLILSLIIPYGLVLVLHGIAWGEKPKEERILLSLPELIHLAIAKSPEIGEIQSEIACNQK